MKRTWNNIGKDEINEFLSMQSEFIDDPILEISLKRTNEFYGEIDLLFLSYAIILLKKNRNLRLEINFTEPVDNGRFFSFSDQVSQAKYLYSFLNDRNLKIVGSYVEKSTGEVIECKNYRELNQSSSFAPVMLIYKYEKKQGSTIDSFFDDTIDTSSQLVHLYNQKLLEEIISIVESSIVSTRQKIFIEDFTARMKGFSFIKLCLMRILIEKGEGNIFKRKGAKENVDVLLNIESFCSNLIVGIKELAKNIIDHSGSEGAISVRKFKREVLKDLKEVDENNFIDLDSNADVQSFLDINVIDLGSVDLRKNYVSNLESTKKVFLDKVSAARDNYKDSSLYEKILESVNISFDDDIQIIKSSDFEFRNFFIKERLDGINNLSVQKDKFISKIGLQYFTTIVKDTYGGFIKISSFKEKAVLYNASLEGILKVLSLRGYVEFGTAYSCMVPIRNWGSYAIGGDALIQHSVPQDSNTFNELCEYNFITKDEVGSKYSLKGKNIIDYEVEFGGGSQVTKYDGYVDLFIAIKSMQVKFEIESFSKDIIAVSCRRLQGNSISNASHWIRFIWVLTNFFENVILYDIDLVYFKSVKNLRSIFQNTEIDFWDENSRVLFYSKKSQDSNHGYYRYGVNILAGESIAEYNYLNKKIWKHHYSFRDADVFDINEEAVFENSKHLSSVFFSKKGNLHYYEVLLQTSFENDAPVSLFEKSVQYSLNTLLQKKITSDTNNKGYKIDGTHFRLGSKIHISDFYYAKKLFQNSFFTTPLAFMISENIWRSYFCDNKIPLVDSKENSFTIVGYENYSSFLVSSIRNFLDKRKKNGFQNVAINHITIDKDAQLSREKHKLFKNVIIVVPIASSFNTSLKIEDQLNHIASGSFVESVIDFQEVSVIQPTQNVILVAHRDKKEQFFLENHIDENGNVVENTIYDNYNWKNVDKLNKTVVIERYNSVERNERRQKYLIPVYTEWQEAKECDMCFPKGSALDERCLIETGQASITPQIIFGFPKTKRFFSILGGQPPSLSLEGSLLYGNLKNGDNRYLYFNRTGKLIEDNIDDIENWIKRIKDVFNNDSRFKEDFSDKKVVIITPNTGSRSRFLDLINEFLFEYTANCIIISLKEDYIENAEALYSDGLHDADTIIYVDDVLATANSFMEANYIIKYIRNKYLTGDGIDYCIALINRMSYANEENLLLKLRPLFGASGVDTSARLIYFHKINNPTMEEANKEFPLNLERKKYEFLEKNSSLDEIRKYFNSKRSGIKKHNLKHSPPSLIKDYSLDFSRRSKKRNKKLFQLLVLNAIYSIFEYENPLACLNSEGTAKGKSKGDEEWLDRIGIYFPVKKNGFTLTNSDDFDAAKIALDRLRQELLERLRKDIKHRHIINEYESNIDFVILKVICSTPLTYYKQIRESSFHWTLIKLSAIISDVSGLANPVDFYKINKNSNYSYYQDFKFLLKKSVKLKSNFIIHESTFGFFKDQIARLEEISLEDRVRVEEEINPAFFLRLQQICSTVDYLKVPTIKLKIYDFVQNCIKDYIFEEIEFDGNGVASEGISDVSLGSDSEMSTRRSTNEYHKKLIREYNFYRESIPEIQIDLLSEIEQPLVKNEHKPILDRFEADFEDLLDFPRYKLSSSKKFITHIVALIQELVYEHETKSIKLDEVIASIQNNIDSYDSECNENGTFFHLIRLLHLENTEILNKYSKELLAKVESSDEALQFGNRAESLKIPWVGKFSINKQLCRERKYIELCNIQNENNNIGTSIDSFISLKKYLTDLMESRGKEDKIEDIIRSISTKIANVIGENVVEDVFFTVNYKDFEKYDFDDIYTFSLNDSSIKRLELVNSEGSLTSMMGKEHFKAIDNNLFSHFEIIKKGKVLVCRNVDSIRNRILMSDQYVKLEDNRSILLVRLSDFSKRGGGENIFNTLGVITFYLGHSERLSEKKLRLLLALRQNLSRFVKEKAIGTTFLELVAQMKNRKYQKHLKHGIGYYTTYQMEIVQKYENIEDKIRIPNGTESTTLSKELEYIKHASSDFKEFRLLNNSIKGQIGVAEIWENESSLLLCYEYFIDVLETIYKSERLIYREDQANLDFRNEIRFINEAKFEPVLVPAPIIKSVIPELIFNQKKYGTSRVINWSNGEGYFLLEFGNVINNYGSRGINGFGTKMCEDMREKYGHVYIEEDKNDLEYYKITLKILSL